MEEEDANSNEINGAKKQMADEAKAKADAEAKEEARKKEEEARRKEAEENKLWPDGLAHKNGKKVYLPDG